MKEPSCSICGKGLRKIIAAVIYKDKKHLQGYSGRCCGYIWEVYIDKHVEERGLV